MGARIGQRPINQSRPWSTAVDIQRGGVSVYIDPVLIPISVIPFYQGVGILAWNFLIPESVPGSGAWSFLSPELDNFDDQVVGLVFTPTTSSPAVLTAGRISTAAVIAAGNAVFLRGAVVV